MWLCAAVGCRLLPLIQVARSGQHTVAFDENRKCSSKRVTEQAATLKYYLTLFNPLKRMRRAFSQLRWTVRTEVLRCATHGSRAHRGRPTAARKRLPAEGFEPPTYGLQNRCTTTVLSRRGAGPHYSEGAGCDLKSPYASQTFRAYTFSLIGALGAEGVAPNRSTAA